MEPFFERAIIQQIQNMPSAGLDKFFLQQETWNIAFSPRDPVSQDGLTGFNVFLNNCEIGRSLQEFHLQFNSGHFLNLAHIS